jgi:hypothetical protein
MSLIHNEQTKLTAVLINTVASARVSKFLADADNTLTVATPQMGALSDAANIQNLIAVTIP